MTRRLLYTKIENFIKKIEITDIELYNEKMEILAAIKNKSCMESCTPSDWKKGGRCDKNGCYFRESKDTDNLN